MRRARGCSCSSAETPMTSPSSVASSPSGGAKPRVVLVVVLWSCRCVGCLQEWGVHGAVLC
jgi:hypothetical protein